MDGRKDDWWTLAWNSCPTHHLLLSFFLHVPQEVTYERESDKSDEEKERERVREEGQVAEKVFKKRDRERRARSRRKGEEAL